MKTNWKTTINRINSSRFQIPEGWETKDQVAASLECDPDRVGEILKPGIQSGDIERQEFPTWDEKRRMTVRVVCYRPRQAESEQPAAPTTLEEKILDHLRRHPDKPNNAIAKCFKGCTAAMVQQVRNNVKRKRAV